MRLTMIFAAMVAGFSALMAMTVSAVAMPAPSAPRDVVEIIVEQHELGACQAVLEQVLGQPVQDADTTVRLLPVVSGETELPAARCVVKQG